MRDPKRIKKFCNRLARAWEKLPDWRFGQLMVNVLGEMSQKRDPFFPEEDEMIKYIEAYVDKNNPHKKNMFIVFECHKCGHNVYINVDKELLSKIQRFSESECPECGEEGYDNWILKGIADKFPEGNDTDDEERGEDE